MTPKLFLLALAAAISFSACADDGTDTADTAPETAPDTASEPASEPAPDIAPGMESVNVSIMNSRFETAELRVPAGTTVVFENTDAFAHTVTSAEASPMVFGSDELGQGDTFEITFDEPGEYPYFCVIHPTMRATVIVE